MMNENNWAFLNPLISYDAVFFLFKLCDANLWRFQFLSALKIKSCTYNVYLANNLFEKLFIHHFTWILVTLKGIYNAWF